MLPPVAIIVCLSSAQSHHHDTQDGAHVQVEHDSKQTRLRLRRGGRDSLDESDVVALEQNASCACMRERGGVREQSDSQTNLLGALALGVYLGCVVKHNVHVLVEALAGVRPRVGVRGTQTMMSPSSLVFTWSKSQIWMRVF